MINLPALADRVNQIGIMQKAFLDCTREEIEALCTAVFSSFDLDKVPADGWKQPYLLHGELVIPFDCHPDYRWWTPGGKSIQQTLVELDAPYDVARRYVHTGRAMNHLLTEYEWEAMKVPF